MGEAWIAGAKEMLRTIEKLASKQDKDRLDLINLLTASLRAMERSIMGWFQWVLNPGIMGQFTKEELEEISENIRRMAEEFVKYDVEVTDRFSKKMPKRVEQRPEHLYL
ncbi:MAG: DUF2153 family protein [Candidatus Nezhaarchaeales archaeon]